MTLSRWNPYLEMENFRRSMNRMFDEAIGHRDFSIANWKPMIELHDGDEEFKIKAQLPGLSPDNLEITATSDAITIAGEYEDKNEGDYKSEFYYGKFSRTIRLPDPIQNENVEADYTDGILTLTLPKVKEAAHKTVKVQLGGQEKPAIGAETQS
jgi:HSP20 family protein